MAVVYNNFIIFSESQIAFLLMLQKLSRFLHDIIGWSLIIESLISYIFWKWWNILP